MLTRLKYYIVAFTDFYILRKGIVVAFILLGQ